MTTFFLVVWFGSPHSPFSGYDEDIAPFRHLGQQIAARFAEIAALDRAMGTLRTELEKMGVRDNTLLWFNSDNGVTTQEIPKDQLQHLDNGGLRGHKSQMYEG